MVIKSVLLLTSCELDIILQAPKKPWDVVAWILNVFSGFYKMGFSLNMAGSLPLVLHRFC